MSDVLAIVRIGSGGDGVAETADGPVYVPFALPGETYERHGERDFVRVGAASALRQVPPCRHFEICGGCIAQHMSHDTYIAWKRGIIDSAFRHHGVALPEYELIETGAGQRRRVVLTAQDTGRGIVVGFHAAGSHQLVDLTMCTVMKPEIAAVLPGLRTLSGMLFAARAKPGQTKAGRRHRGDEIRLTVALLNGAIEVAAHGVGATLDREGRVDAAALAARHGLQRISVDDDVVLVRDTPSIVTSGGKIVPQPGAFFQAVESAEHAMAEVVCAGVGKAKRVADLFAGLGTFTLPLARRARVEAIDTEAVALEALTAATKTAQGLKPISTRQRDLMKEPLSLMELKDFDAVVIDPPRAGAKTQAEVLAKSDVGRVVMVSCNPVTLARDVAALMAGGYQLERFVAFDQFLWTAHVEAVAVLGRGKKR